MARDPLLTTLLDLDAILESQELIIGGGYGLYLKQLYLKQNPQIRTLFPPSTLPSARTTEDIDLILRAEVVTDSKSMKAIRDALDTLGFAVVATAKYTQFVRDMQPGQVKIDLLAGPLGEFANRVPKDARRVKPRPAVGLHASKLEEAVAVDRETLRIPISGAALLGAYSHIARAHSTDLYLSTDEALRLQGPHGRQRQGLRSASRPRRLPTRGIADAGGGRGSAETQCRVCPHIRSCSMPVRSRKHISLLQTGWGVFAFWNTHSIHHRLTSSDWHRN